MKERLFGRLVVSLLAVSLLGCTVKGHREQTDFYGRIQSRRAYVMACNRDFVIHLNDCKAVTVVYDSLEVYRSRYTTFYTPGISN